jgi:hypothetical protein
MKMFSRSLVDTGTGYKHFAMLQCCNAVMIASNIYVLLRSNKCWLGIAGAYHDYINA